MARPLRIESRGALYHVISRGNEQRSIVTDDRDRTRRLDWLRRTVQTYGWNLHAFVLMTNHEHLFVETPEANLSTGMQYLNGSISSVSRSVRYVEANLSRYRKTLRALEGKMNKHILNTNH